MAPACLAISLSVVMASDPASAQLCSRGSSSLRRLCGMARVDIRSCLSARSSTSRSSCIWRSACREASRCWGIRLQVRIIIFARDTAATILCGIAPPAIASSPQLLTDDRGTIYDISIPPPAVSHAAIDGMRTAADHKLAPQFRACWRMAEQPFLQAIYDVQSPRLAFGQVALVRATHPTWRVRIAVPA